MKEKLTRQQTKHKPDHSQSKVGNELADKKFASSHGRHEERLERSPFPFPGDHHRSEERADNRHDQDNQTGDYEIMAVIRLVEPYTTHDDGRADRNRGS